MTKVDDTALNLVASTEKRLVAVMGEGLVV